MLRNGVRCSSNALGGSRNARRLFSRVRTDQHVRPLSHFAGKKTSRCSVFFFFFSLPPCFLLLPLLRPSALLGPREGQEAPHTDESASFSRGSSTSRCWVPFIIFEGSITFLVLRVYPHIECVVLKRRRSAFLAARLLDAAGGLCKNSCATLVTYVAERKPTTKCANRTINRSVPLCSFYEKPPSTVHVLVPAPRMYKSARTKPRNKRRGQSRCMDRGRHV